MASIQGGSRIGAVGDEGIDRMLREIISSSRQVLLKYLPSSGDLGRGIDPFSSSIDNGR